jgi:intein/homing endonuclease
LDSCRHEWRQHCVLENTRVLTSIGHKNVQDIQTGDIVYSHNPDTKKTEPTKVKSILKMGKQPIVEVETNHRKIRVTPNHGLLVKDSKGSFYYKKAEDLLLSSIKFQSFQKNQTTKS